MRVMPTPTMAGSAGPGDLPHIFKRFFRTDKARARSDGNTGLGLVICKPIVDAPHGSIDARSSPGEGTAFTVRLPRADARS